MTNIVSSGELKKGMFVIAYELLEPVNTQEKIIISNEEQIEKEEWKNEDKPIKYEFKINYYPWYKGIPWEIVCVCKAMVGVKTFGTQNLPPVMFFDSRFVRFLEVDKKFYKNYWKSMGISFDKNTKDIKAPPKPKKTELVKN